MDPFDGAGREYRQPRYRTILVLRLVIVVLIVAVWVIAAYGTNVPAASPGR